MSAELCILSAGDFLQHDAGARGMASPIMAMTAQCLLPSDIISSRFIGVGLSGLSHWQIAVNFNGAATARQPDRRAQMSSGSETGRQIGTQWKQDSLWRWTAWLLPPAICHTQTSISRWWARAANAPKAEIKAIACNTLG